MRLVCKFVTVKGLKLQDYGKQVENTVKGFIAEACMSMGINKDEAGFCVGGGGTIGPQMITNPETGEPAIVGFAPTWQVTVGLRNLLLGKDPIIKSLSVFGVLPNDAAFKTVVYRLVSECDTERRAQ